MPEPTPVIEFVPIEKAMMDALRITPVVQGSAPAGERMDIETFEDLTEDRGDWYVEFYRTDITAGHGVIIRDAFRGHALVLAWFAVRASRSNPTPFSMGCRRDNVVVTMDRLPKGAGLEVYLPPN